MHPIHALRRHLDVVGSISAADYGDTVAPRVKHVNALVLEGVGDARDYKADPLPESSLPGVVQNIEGLGPEFLKRGVLVK
jgi:hypothetical protein